MEVYIVRHGKTIWNEQRLLQGQSDIDLNYEGREAAITLGKTLGNVDFDMIFSSPLIRAYETACLIRGHRNIPIIRDQRIQELSFGIMEGCTYDEWDDPNGKYGAFFNAPEKYVPPEDGESLDELRARTESFLKEMIEPLYATKKRIMIVAHGAANKGMLCHIFNYDNANFWGSGLQKNCEAIIVNYDGNCWSC